MPCLIGLAGGGVDLTLQKEVESRAQNESLCREGLKKNISPDDLTEEGLWDEGKYQIGNKLCFVMCAMSAPPLAPI